MVFLCNATHFFAIPANGHGDLLQSCISTLRTEDFGGVLHKSVAVAPPFTKDPTLQSEFQHGPCMHLKHLECALAGINQEQASDPESSEGFKSLTVKHTCYMIWSVNMPHT